MRAFVRHALILCLLGFATTQAAWGAREILDWELEGWNAGDLTRTYTGIGNGDVTVTFTDADSALRDISGTPSPQLSSNYTGGLNPIEQSLTFRTDFPNSGSPEIVITIDFTHPGGVRDVSFSMFDIDNEFTNDDQVAATAVAASVTVDPTSVTVGPGVSFDGVRTVTGTTNCNPTSADCNVTFDFAQTAITRLILVVRNVQPFPGLQDIVLHDIEFTDGASGHSISGTVFDDADFAGTASDWDGGGADRPLEDVEVELYDGSNSLLGQTSTDASGAYSFTGLSPGPHIVRVRAATIGDADTVPADGFHACVPTTCDYPLAEMTWADGPLIGGRIPRSTTRRPPRGPDRETRTRPSS